MDRNAIREHILRKLDEAGLPPEEVRVQPDPFSGWRVVVISPGFERKSQSERRKIVLSGLENIEMEWCELLTPEEAEWFGPLPIDSDLDDLPLWAEALAPKKKLEDVVFPSDVDEDLEPPVVATFYSLRGGVGRSTALAYAARILASHGRKVLCVDMDLEAPGLAGLFGVEDKVGNRMGVVQLLLELDQGQKPDFSKHLIRMSERDDLYLLPAGKPDANYARMLRFIDPLAWYREERNPLHLLMDGLRDSLPFRPDIVLIDARTGITPISAPLLFDVADAAIIIFFPHPQAKTGTGALVSGLLAAHTRRSSDKRFTPELRFVVSPIPSSKAPEVIDRYQHRSLEWIAGWIEPLNQSRGPANSLSEAEITHFVRYREDLATADTILADQEVWRAFQPIAEWTEGLLPSTIASPVAASIASRKVQALNELSFAAGTAEDQESLLETYVETDVFRKAKEPQIPLVLGRKGAGKTALFRRLAEDAQTSCIVVHAPGPLRQTRNWILSIDGFDAVGQAIVQTKTDWRRFWAFYICVASAHVMGTNLLAPPPQILNDLPTSVTEMIKAFRRTLSVPEGALLLNDWLKCIDRVAKSGTLLLFDGLDTGFGASADQRERRRNALEDLFTLWTDQGSGLNNLRFKIILREDIWKQLQFDNKSHLYGRSVTLKWSDQVAYFMVVLKQALRSPSFSVLLSESSQVGCCDPDHWGEREVLAAWHILVGERMKGGKTAFTRNWVWNRLADANNDHTPSLSFSPPRALQAIARARNGRLA